jgi:hypothetical protein
MHTVDGHGTPPGGPRPPVRSESLAGRRSAGVFRAMVSVGLIAARKGVA